MLTTQILNIGFVPSLHRLGGRFVAVTHGEDERVMPGHALAMQTDKPFRSLQQVKKEGNKEGREGQICLVL